jgi:hypothetical protein
MAARADGLQVTLMQPEIDADPPTVLKRTMSPTSGSAPS